LLWFFFFKKNTKGNQKLSSKQYNEAVESYTKAINLNPENAIYYANRAAALSHLGNLKINNHI